MKTQAGDIGCSGKRSGQMNCTAWSSRILLELTGLKGGKEARECARHFSLLHTYPQSPPKEISLGCGGGMGGRNTRAPGSLGLA